jgi:hypothetical protein
VFIKTEHVVSLIADYEHVSFDDAYREFVDSQTYTALVNATTLLWAESAEFILDEYCREKAQ